MATKFPLFLEDMDIIQKLGDTPGTDDNLSSEELQARFDKGGNLLKKHLNKIIETLNTIFSGDGNVIAGGILIGDLDVNGNRLFGVGAPSDNKDAANKEYVDRAATTAAGSKLPFTGGSMKGPIHMSGKAIDGLPQPVNGADAATKSYVDGKRFTRSVSLGLGWTGSGPYSQSVVVSGIVESDTPHVTLIYSGDKSTDLKRKEAWDCVSGGTAVNGGLRFTCLENKPATAIPLQVEVIR